MSVIGCLVRDSGNEYWLSFGFVLLLLTWGVVVRKRERVQPRPLLHALALFGWVFAMVSVERVDHDGWLFLLRGSAWTVACVYLEIILSPSPERIPRAIAREPDRDPP